MGGGTLYLKLKWLKRNNGGSWANCWFSELATGWIASRILIGFLLDLGCFSVTRGWPHIFLLELTLELPVTCEPLKLKFAKNPNTSRFSATLDAQQPHGTAASVEICVECVLHHSKSCYPEPFILFSLSLSHPLFFDAVIEAGWWGERSRWMLGRPPLDTNGAKRILEMKHSYKDDVSSSKLRNRTPTQQINSKNGGLLFSKVPSWKQASWLNRWLFHLTEMMVKE